MLTDEPRSRAALFVDFDNIYSGLRALDPAAAEAFATDPAQWVGWLGGGGEHGNAGRRRFLLQLCYLNPNVFSRYRAFFLRSGFKVVDCPPLTAQGKTSADIQIVLDVVDALGHQTRYDEFVIASADADFTPLLFRLRAHDRRTTVVTAGPASAAYRALCDSVILPDRFADAVLGLGSSSAAAMAADSTAAQVGSAAQLEPAVDASARVATAVDAVRAAVAVASAPLVSGAAAQAAIRAWPEIAAEGWAGAGTFSAFVGRFAPEVGWASQPPPGYLYDPARHSPADLPQVPDAPPVVLLDQVADQVCRVTGTPRLAARQYEVLFEELAADLTDRPFALSDTGKAVRDRVVNRGESVSRGAVNFVLQGLIFSGHGLPSGSTKRELARGFARNVRTLCRNAQMELDEADLKTIQLWLTGEPH